MGDARRSPSLSCKGRGRMGFAGAQPILHSLLGVPESSCSCRRGGTDCGDADGRGDDAMKDGGMRFAFPA